MPFPFTIEYSRTIQRSISAEKYPEILKHISEILAPKPAKDFLIENNTLKFKPGFSFWNWNIMATIDRGRFTITEKTDGIVLTYEFFMYKLFIFSSIAALFFGIASQMILAGVGAFFGFCGMNWIIALVRHGSMFNEIANEVDVFMLNQSL